MKKTAFTKSLSFVLALIMILSALPLTATSSFADFGTSGDWVYRTLDESTAEIYNYNGSDTVITIPSSINGYRITGIDSEAFKYNTKIKTITMPNSVTSLDNETFRGCTSLSNISISDNITHIPSCAFDNCSSLKSITLPSKLELIDESAFEDCTLLTSVIIPNNVTNIERRAFYGCSSLKYISISDNVTNIGSGAFKDTAYYKNESNWTNGVLYIGKYLVDVKSKNISGQYNVKNGTRVIANNAFQSCTSLTRITMPNTLVSIGLWAFDGCSSLSIASLPDSLISIEWGAFRNCTSLTDLIIPSNVSEIGSEAFTGCSSLKNLIILSRNITIYRKAFYNCTSLASISIPYGALKIYDDVFLNTSYYNNDNNWENGILYIDNCLIKAKKDINNGYKIKEDTLIIATEAFYDCVNLKELIIPSSVKRISGFGTHYLLDVYYLGNENSWNEINPEFTIGRNPKIHYCHSVTYDYYRNGGSYATKQTDIIEIGESIDLSPIAYKDDKSFVGWNTDVNANSGLTNMVMPDYDVVLYAIFKDEESIYTISYNANGGTNAPSSQTKEDNEDILLSKDKPTKTFKITYNANGGSVSPSSKNVNCTFKNWNTKANGSGTSYSSGATYNDNSSVTLYAQWDNPTAGTLATPTRKGYTFLGWFTSASGGTKITTSSKINGHTTLYAHWEKIPSLTKSDQFSFGNSRTEFTHYNYYITDNDFKKLTDNVKKIYNNNYYAYQTVINELQYQRNLKWQGSCYGMAVATLLDKSNKIGFNENFGNNAKTMYEVQSPRNNSAVESAINYYFLSQFIYPVRLADAKHYEKKDSDWKAGLRQLSSMVKDDIPMLFCYWSIGADGVYGHAIVTKGYQELSDGSLNIIAYDNRYPDNDIIVKISSDYKTCVVNGNEDAIGVEYTQDMSAFDQIDIDGSNNVYTLNSYGANNSNNSQQAILTINPMGKVTVENAKGEKLIVENGEISGDMDAALSSFNVGGTVDGEGNLSFVFTVDDSDYFMFESDSDKMDVSVLSDDIYGHAATDGANYVVISKNDGISVLGKKFSYDISLSINNSLCDMLSINGNATNDVKLEKKKSSIKATGVDDKNGEVTVFSNIVDVEQYGYKSGYDSFEVVSDDSNTSGNINIMGSSKNNGIYDINIGTSSSGEYKGFPDVKEGDWYYDVVKYVAEKGYITGYQNKNFGPNNALKRQDFVCILARIDGADLSAYENQTSKLTDVKKGDYYAAAVNWAVDKGYISGYKNGKFGVNDPITREQVATILYNYMNKPNVKDADKILAKFPDANKVSGFAKTPVAWAVDKGIISGMGNGTVASTSGATRAQIAAIIERMDKQGMFNN